MIEKRSASKQLSKYDIWSTVRDIALIALTFSVTHADMIEAKLAEWGVDPVAIAFILFALLELGRKYAKNYSEG